MAYIGLLPSFGSSLGSDGSVVYGLLMTAVGFGSISGPVALAGWAGRANERRLLVATAVLSGLALAWLGTSRDVAWASAAAVSVGASQSLFMVVLYKETQGIASDVMRGRVASLTFFFTAGVMGLFNLGLGALATVLPAGWVMMGSGLIFVLATFCLLQRVPALRWRSPAPGAPLPSQAAG